MTEARESGLNVLLSSEGFENWWPRHLQPAEGTASAPTELHVVYAIRDPLDLFYARWAQHVKSGVEQSLPDYHAKHFADPLTSKVAQSDAAAGTSAAADRCLGNASCTMTRSSLQELDIFSVFLDRVLDVSGIEPATQQARNQRFPIELTEFVRALVPLANPAMDKSKIQFGNAVDYLLSESLQAGGGRDGAGQSAGGPPDA